MMRIICLLEANVVKVLNLMIDAHRNLFTLKSEPGLVENHEKNHLYGS